MIQPHALLCLCFCFKLNTAYEMRISDWSSDGCSPDLADYARRFRTLLVRYPNRIWEDCGHWVNLLGEWTPVNTLAYALSMQTLFRWSHLHDWVKSKTGSRSEEHTSELQSLMRISYAVFCLKKKIQEINKSKKNR